MDEVIWTDLLDAADALRELRPWTWMDDTPPFGVHDSAIDRTAYCCVMGAAGTLLGLAVYDGPEGYECMQDLAEGTLDPVDGMYQQHAMTVTFGARDELDSEMYRLIKRLGRRYRGRDAWPDLTVRRPGMVPRLPTDIEVRFLTHVLREALELCARVREQPTLLHDGLLVRRDGSDTFPAWIDGPEEEPPAPLDQVAFQRAVRDRGVVERSWWGDWFTLPSAVSDADGAYFVRIAFWLDLANDIILCQQVLKPGDDPIQVLYGLLLEQRIDHPLAAELVLRRLEAADAFAEVVGDDAPIQIMSTEDPTPTLQLAAAFAEFAGG